MGTVTNSTRAHRVRVLWLIATLYGGVDAMPTTFLIDREGRIASVHVGLSGKRDFEDEIQALLRDTTNSSVSAELVRAK